MKDVKESVSNMDELFKNSKLNSKTKFEMLQKAMKKYPELAPIALFRSGNNYESLKITVEGYREGKQAYPSVNRQGNHAKAIQ